MAFTCLRCRVTDGHDPYCPIGAFKRGVVGTALRQLEEAQVARRYGLSQTVVREAGEIVDALA